MKLMTTTTMRRRKKRILHRLLSALRRARFEASLHAAVERDNSLEHEEEWWRRGTGRSRTREERGRVVGGVRRDERVEGVLEGGLHPPHTKDAVPNVTLHVAHKVISRSPLFGAPALYELTGVDASYLWVEWIGDHQRVARLSEVEVTPDVVTRCAWRW
jgi:hypothetical protein